MITLKCDYSKKLGLPGYSSHQFSISLETEIADVTQVQSESARLYKLLQEGVDSSIQNTGYLPGEPAKTQANGHTNGNGHSNGNGQHKPENDAWACSDKQRDLILKITDEHKLDKTKIDQLAIDRFGKGVKQLNKLEASGLIDELFVQTGQTKPRNGRYQKAGAR